MRFDSLFSGKMLGDGYMNKSHKSPRFCFVHAFEDKAYADHCFHIFSEYLDYNVKCKNHYRLFDSRTQKTYHRVYYQSRTSPILKRLYSIWYMQGQKIIPKEYVANNLNADGLALWYQDDGCLKNNDDRIILSTESFSMEEIVFLQELLKVKFNVLAHIDSKNRLDISSRREVRKFQALVEQHIDSSMDRKSSKDKWKEWENYWTEGNKNSDSTYRTSVYVPFTLYSLIRGQGYSKLLNGLLGEWMDKQWFDDILDPLKRYNWIVSHESIKKGEYLLTPRLNTRVKIKLDLLSKATGYQRSELVTFALVDYFRDKGTLR